MFTILFVSSYLLTFHEPFCTENQEQTDVYGNDGGLPGDPHEPVEGREPLTGRLIHHMTELHDDEDPGGGGPALQLVLDLEHDPVLGARRGEQEVRERGVIQLGQGELGVILMFNAEKVL